MMSAWTSRARRSREITSDANHVCGVMTGGTASQAAERRGRPAQGGPLGAKGDGRGSPPSALSHRRPVPCRAAQVSDLSGRSCWAWVGAREKQKKGQRRASTLTRNFAHREPQTALQHAARSAPRPVSPDAASRRALRSRHGPGRRPAAQRRRGQLARVRPKSSPFSRSSGLGIPEEPASPSTPRRDITGRGEPEKARVEGRPIESRLRGPSAAWPLGGTALDSPHVASVPFLVLSTRLPAAMTSQKGRGCMGGTR